VTRTLPFAVVIPIASGSDRDVIEIDDCREVVGDWPEVIEPCDKSPDGQCVYGWPDDRACKYCGRLSGLDE
jgi:hypothetical protein